MYFVYLLRCKDDSLYCGQTNNLEKRMKEHSDSKNKAAKYTRGRGPLTLVYIEKHMTLSSALKRECEIKRLSKIKKELLVQRPNNRNN